MVLLYDIQEYYWELYFKFIKQVADVQKENIKDKVLAQAPFTDITNEVERIVNEAH